jgi:hypothetical protein
LLKKDTSSGVVQLSRSFAMESYCQTNTTESKHQIRMTEIANGNLQ